MRERIRHIIEVAFALGISACLAEPADPSVDGAQDAAREVAVSSAAVVGGQMSAACGWPSTVDVSGCTGTLIHPRVVTTAAHCMSRSSMKITFTGGKNVPGSFSVMGTCKKGRGGGNGGDWAYCMLPEDPRIAAIPTTPPLVGCEADRFLKPGASAWIVGFGETAARKNDVGIKREVEVKVNKVGNGTIDVGDKSVGACHGDSGGPIYMHLKDGTHDWGWRVFGSTTGAGSSCDCCTTTVYTDIRNHVKAIEATEKIDVTPCTDETGKWAPSPACGALPGDLQHATGTYPMCSFARTTEPIASCDGATAAPAAGSPAVGMGSAGVPARPVSGAGAPAPAAGSGALAGAAAPSGPVVPPGAAGAVPPPPVGIAGAPAAVTAAPTFTTGTAGTQPRAAGSVGTQTSPVLTAGVGAALTTAPPAAPKSSGCHVISAGSARTANGWPWGLLGAALLCGRRRRRQ